MRVALRVKNGNALCQRRRLIMMNTVPATSRMCQGCGLDLHGKSAYPILDQLACSNSHCISSVYVQNIHRLEPSEQARIGRHLQDRRCQEMRDYQMRKVYGTGINNALL